MPNTAPSQNKTRKIISESLFLYSAIYFFSFFKFLSGFFVAKFLGPTFFGLRNLFGIIVENASFAHLGTYDAMCKEVPFFRGKKDSSHATMVIENVFTFNVLYSLLVLILCILLAIFLFNIHYEPIYIHFVLFFGFYTVCEKFKQFGTSQLIVDKKTSILSKATLLEGVSYSSATILFTYFWGLTGLFIGLSISIFMVDLFLISNLKSLPKFRMSSFLIKKLLLIGFPIMSISLMFIILRSVDRLIIAAFLSKENLGFFGVGTIISGLIYFSFADVVRSVYAPRIMERLGQSESKLVLVDYLLQPTLIIAYLTPVIIGTLYMAIHIPIVYYLPDYTPAIGVVRILSLGSFFISIAMISMIVIVALNLQFNLLFIMSAIILLNATFSYTFILAGMGIKGVAIGTCLSYFILSFICLLYTMRQFQLSFSFQLHNIVLIYAPFLYSLALLFTYNKVFFKYTGVFLTDIIHTGVSLLLFYALFFLSFFLIYKQAPFTNFIKLLPRFNVPNAKKSI
jgi:O-antigen/teichoic acid export membrane protein